jgi:tetratricopeptide (TPR) repeat protein
MDFEYNDIPESKRATVLGCLLLLAFLIYANSLTNGFVYDDHSLIEHNPYVHSLENIPKLFSTSSLAYLGKGKQEIRNYYRPAVGLEFLLCFKLFGSFPQGFHLVSVLMHCLVVWLVYKVTAELLSDETFGLVAAACFALHPIHTEAVDWIAAVADIEMSIFYLVAFWLFLRLGREEARRGLWMQAAMLGSFLLAAWSKEIAMTLPAVVTIYEHFCRADRQQSSWKKKLSRYAGFWVTGLLYLAARATVLGGLAPVGLHADVGAFETAVTAVALIGRYAARLVWPAPLAAFYPFQKSTSFLDSWVLLGAAMIATAAAFLVCKRKRTRVYIFALLWMLFTIAPVLNVHWMTAIVFAERYLYLPSVGFSWLAAGAILWCWRKSGDGTRQRRWAVGVAASTVALLFAGETLARNRDWKDDGVIAFRTLEVYPEISFLRSNLGMGLWQAGNHAEALRQWQIALAYKAASPEVLANIGFAMVEEGKYAEAIPPLQQAIALSPQFAIPHVYLARVYTALGENAQAEGEFKSAVEILPTNAPIRNALGRFYLEAGRPREAQTEFLTSVTADATEEGWSGLAEAYTLLDGPEKAEAAWQQVVALDPFHSRAHLSLARIYLATGRSAAAEKEFESCLFTDPRNTEALAAVRELRLQADFPSSP